MQNVCVKPSKMPQSGIIAVHCGKQLFVFITKFNENLRRRSSQRQTLHEIQQTIENSL